MKTSVSWTIGARWLFNSLGMISTLILVRLLTPEDFGLIAMVTVVVAFLELFADQGFETYLITVKRINRAHYETVWTLKLLVYLLLGFSLVSSRGIIADFYGDHRLEDIVIALTIPFISGGLQNVRLAGFQRRLNYRPFFLMQVVPKVFSFILTISMAFIFRSYWALIVGVISGSLVRLVLSFYLRPWLPRLTLSKIGDVIGYTRWLFVNNLLSFTNVKGVELVIGKILGAEPLGFFGLAKELGELPNKLVFAPMNRALLSGYAAVKQDPQELAQMIQYSLSIMIIIALPSGIGMAMVAQQVVFALFGEQWLPLVPALRWLAAATPFLAVNSAFAYVFLALERPPGRVIFPASLR